MVSHTYVQCIACTWSGVATRSETVVVLSRVDRLWRTLGTGRPALGLSAQLRTKTGVISHFFLHKIVRNGDLKTSGTVRRSDNEKKYMSELSTFHPQSHQICFRLPALSSGPGRSKVSERFPDMTGPDSINLFVIKVQKSVRGGPTQEMLRTVLEDTIQACSGSKPQI